MINREQIKNAGKVFGPIGAVAGFISDVLMPIAPIVNWIFYGLLAFSLISGLAYIARRRGKQIFNLHEYLPQSLILTIVFGSFSVLSMNSNKGFLADNVDQISVFQKAILKLDEGVQRVEIKVDNIQGGINEIKEIVTGESELKNMTSTDDLNATKRLNERTKDINALRLAIIYFDNSGGDPALNKLKKGLADMMITDLSNVNMLSIVERDKLEAILQEQKLNNSKQFNPTTAAKVGKLLGAQIILTGSFFEMMGSMRIDARFIDVETGKIIKSDGVDGLTSNFFKLQRQLSWKIINNVDVKLSEAEKQSLQKSQETSNLSFEDIKMYSEALDLYDANDVKQAAKILDKILNKYPTFEPAKNVIGKINKLNL